MIPGQAECFLSHFRHKYKEIPNFAEVYNYTLKSLREADIEISLLIIDEFIKGLLKRQDLSIPIYDKKPNFYVVKNGKLEIMMPLWQVCKQYNYITALVERDTFEMVNFRGGGKRVTIHKWRKA